MPIYEFKCPCGCLFDLYRPLSKFSRSADCDACGGVANLMVSRPHSDMIEFAVPVVLHSIGCTSVGQIRQMRQAGVTISDDPADPLYGTPIAHSRKEKLRALRVAGYQEKK